jgi:hypothetical protein
MRARARLCSLLAVLTLATGCALVGGRTPEAGAPYVSTKFCGFELDGRTREVRFAMDLVVHRRVPAGALLEVEFENPLDERTPVVVTRELAGNERELRILSTPVRGIARREYRMVARLYPSRARGELLATHVERCAVPFADTDVGLP